MPNYAPPADADTPPAAAYDTPWKIAIEQHFQAFMAFYFPLAHAQIDWAFPHEFLDKELQAIAKSALVGTRHVDKLVKVRRLSGEEDWICIHVEVQVSRYPNFAQRMYIYNYRIFDLYERPAASMAVLGDDDARWLPQQFGFAALGCEMGFRFPVNKLLHYTGQEAELEANPNPFALLTLAYLKNRATSSNMLARFEIKCKLVRLLHARDWDATLIRQFFLVIDWMMALPPELELKLSRFMTELEEERKMDYISSVERVRTEQAVMLAKQEGLQEGWQGGVQGGEAGMLCRLLTRRFGDLPQATVDQVKSASREQIEAWFDRGIGASTLDEVFQDAAH